MKIGIIIGSVRETRFGEQVAAWVARAAAGRTDATFEVVDLREFEVPILTTSVMPSMARKRYASANVQRWSDAVDACDGFVFVTPEYNYSIPGAFKNAFDSLGSEWAGKPVAFVSYGTVGGARAVQHWRDAVANFSMDDLRAHVPLFAGFDYQRGAAFEASERRSTEIVALLDAIVAATAKG